MLHPLSYLVFFAWILAVQLTGLAAFTKGFFLTRVELGLQSECDVSEIRGGTRTTESLTIGTKLVVRMACRLAVPHKVVGTKSAKKARG